MSQTVSEKQSDEVRLPNSRKVYVESTRLKGVRVPLREVTQHATKTFDGRTEENPPVRVYDTSGPWGDPLVRCDVRDGLAALRREWILARAAVEEEEGREIIPPDDAT